jgi:hypothetical protein
MHPGILTTMKAARLKLSRLTFREDPAHVLLLWYTTGHSRTLVRKLYVDWCHEEAARIATDPHRHAAVVEHEGKVAVYVNCVAGDLSSRISDDEV